jgi:hypothetical protein
MKKLLVLFFIFVFGLGVSCMAQTVKISFSTPSVSFSLKKKFISMLCKRDTITPVQQTQVQPVSVVIIHYDVITISDFKQNQYRLEQNLRDSINMDPTLSFDYRPFDHL